jgi:hypothetical protein
MIQKLAEYARALDASRDTRQADCIDRVIRAAARDKKLKLTAEEAGAIYAFMGWLTTREKKAGPFSGHDEASEAADLVADFCKANGFDTHLSEFEPVIKSWKSPRGDKSAV